MVAELSNYLDDELDDSLCEELEKHMDGCEPCKEFLSSLEKSIQQCRMARVAVSRPQSPHGCKTRLAIVGEVDRYFLTPVASTSRI